MPPHVVSPWRNGRPGGELWTSLPWSTKGGAMTGTTDRPHLDTDDFDEVLDWVN